MKPEERLEVFVSHFDELRKRLFFSISILMVTVIFSYFFSDAIISFLTRPLSQLSQKTYFLSPYDAFLVKLQVAFWAGVFLASPVLFREIWLFVAPGLYRRERKMLVFLLFSSLILLVAGLATAFFAVVPTTMRFFLKFSTNELVPLISISEYLNFVVWTGIAFGVAFEIPLFLIGLVKLGVLEVKQLARARPYLIVLIFVFAAIATPSPDPLSQCLLAIPLWILFEASLIISRATPTKRLAKALKASI